jgi:hypothetical protein
MATGYEIRHSLLNEATGILFEKWQLEPLPEAPTVADIKALAEDLYEFVQRK